MTFSISKTTLTLVFALLAGYGAGFLTWHYINQPKLVACQMLYTKLTEATSE